MQEFNVKTEAQARHLDSGGKAPQEPTAEMVGDACFRACGWEKGVEWAACFSLHCMPPSTAHAQKKHSEMLCMGKIKRGIVKTATS